MTRCETLREIELGRVHLTIDTVYDESPDFSYLGKFSRMNWHPETYVYHRPSGLMYDGRFWRDERGRIQAEPDLDDAYSHEYQFIDIGDCQFQRSDKHSLRYAFQNAKRLDRLDDYWCYLAVRATVDIDGRELGSASVWGIESDSDKSYFAEVGREVAQEAISEARQFIGSLA